MVSSWVRWTSVAALVVTLSSLTHIPPVGSAKSAATASLAAIQTAPPAVKHSILRACGNCHSAATKWPWYAYVPVVSYVLQADVADARSHLDLSSRSQWLQMKPEDRAAAYSGICENMLSGAMPKKRYLFMHPEAKLTGTDVQAVCDWANAESRLALAGK